ncbi:MAG: HD domain-containing protein [Planctomycetaceae bacterium]|nr:HD domain-containing protein [Planctomycetaceae bacterium]
MKHSFLNDKKSQRIIDLLEQGGATAVYFVGGAVRDHLLEHADVKDIDIEVYGLDYGEIVALLAPHFRVGLVGRSFGTIKVDQRIDIGIPRRESKQGHGHKGFDVTPDPNMTFAEAARRRDFTINAIGMKRDGTPVDPYHGIDDIRKKTLRATSDAFGEDPLRVLRGMQFASRFGFQLEPSTVLMCRLLREEFATLSPERVWGEWEKWALKSKFPSAGLRVLEETGWLACFPELAALVDTPQHPHWHGEGNAFEHVKAVVDAAEKIATIKKLTGAQKLVLMFAALLHDVGKPVTLSEKEPGVWYSPGHAAAGVPLAKAFLEKMLAPGWVVEQVLPLVREHQAHVVINRDETPDDTMIRRLADRLAPATLRQWADLCAADAAGCQTQCRPHSLEIWLENAKRLGILDRPPTPILLGRDLIALGMSPGPEMGTILKAAFEAQLDGEFLTHKQAIEWLKTHVAV